MVKTIENDLEESAALAADKLESGGVSPNSSTEAPTSIELVPTGSTEAPTSDNNITSGLTDQAREEIVALIQTQDAEQKAPEKLLPPDTYSFFALAPLQSGAFLLATVCVCIQLSALTIVCYDQFYSGNQSKNNVLGVPPYVPWTVKITQLLALAIATVNANDVLWSLNVLYKGYAETALKEDVFPKEEDRPNYLKARWFVSLGFRLLQGLFCLAVMFMLIMRASTARNVLLSFNAVFFITNLDNVLFGLSKWGYFGAKLKEDAENPCIGEVTIELVKGRVLIRISALLVIFLTLAAFWLWIGIQQSSGKYLTKSIYVQFGDEENNELGLYSGVYDLVVDKNDITYISRHNMVANLLTLKVEKQFRYCSSKRFWTLMAPSVEDVSSSYDVCKDWVVKSSSTDSYNILEVANSKWYVKADPESGRTGDIQMTNFRMLKHPTECTDNEEIYGPLCEFSDPCESLVVDGQAFHLDINWGVFGVELGGAETELLKPYFGKIDIDSGARQVQYNILRNDTNAIVLVYDRPVYYATAQSTDDYMTAKVIMCLGRRWVRIVVGIEGQEDLALALLPHKAEVLEEVFKRAGGVASTFRYITHISEPFDVGTLSDTGSPEGLKFYHARTNGAFKLDWDNPVPDRLACKCEICPDGSIMAVSEEMMDQEFVVDVDSSALFGKQQRCNELSGIQASSGTWGCRSLQMASIFQCGCPYVDPPKESLCPLCLDGSESIDWDYIPFPDRGLFQGETCKELYWEVNLRADRRMGDNPKFCPGVQSTLGAICGCSNPPTPSCDITCPSEDNFFHMQGLVSDSQLNHTYSQSMKSRFDNANGTLHCGEVMFATNVLPEDLCNDEWKNALTEICCVPK